MRRAAHQFERGDDPLSEAEVGVGAGGDRRAGEGAHRPDECAEDEAEDERAEAPFEGLGHEEEGPYPREDAEEHPERQTRRQPVGRAEAGRAQTQPSCGSAEQIGDRGWEGRRCRLGGHLRSPPLLAAFP